MNNYYDKYWSKDWLKSFTEITQTELKLFSKYINVNDLCIDYGCGHGRYGFHLVQKKINYIGCDVSEDVLKIIRQRQLETKIIDVNGKCDLKNNSVDSAICFEVLEHLMNPENAVEELYRILKPNGILLLSVPNAGYILNRIEFFLTGFYEPGGSPETYRASPWIDPHIRFFNKSLLNKLIEKFNFLSMETDSEPFTFSHFPIIRKNWKLKMFFKKMTPFTGYMGKFFPSLFSHRIYCVAQKK